MQLLRSVLLAHVEARVHSRPRLFYRQVPYLRGLLVLVMISI